MITFNFETPFELKEKTLLTNWILDVVKAYGFTVEEINYIFCDDAYLHKLNVDFLQHDALTDIISFDNTIGKLISGDVFISVERVADNAKDYKVSFEEELRRVMIHGVLHYMGFKDKSIPEKTHMTVAEDKALSMINN
jgi:rRNA maturation RNase YbeY